MKKILLFLQILENGKESAFSILRIFLRENVNEHLSDPSQTQITSNPVSHAKVLHAKSNHFLKIFLEKKF